ncbi:hypothetical protein HZ326_31435, partial [Fusarium oxysporum f. sp. albedinis]
MLLNWIGAGSEPQSNPVQTWGQAASSISRTDPVQIAPKVPYWGTGRAELEKLGPIYTLITEY